MCRSRRPALPPLTVDAECAIVVEVALLDAAVFECDLAEQRGGQAKNDAAFDLRLHRVRVDDDV